MTEIIVEFFRKAINNDYLTIIIIALLPIIELRGAIPVALGMGMSPLAALAVAFIGSSIVVPFLLLLLKPVLGAMKKIKLVSRIAEVMEGMFQSKADKVIKKAEIKGRKIDGKVALKYKLLGILAFVALPLPLTGVWTGSAVAAFLDIKFIPALITVILGNLCAGIIMTVLSVFFIAYLDIILTAFLSLVVFILVFYIISIVIKSRKIDSNRE